MRRLLAAGNLVANGDFSLGNSGFTNDYTYGSVGADGSCVVGDNPYHYHLGGASFPDHTTGTGLMLVVNGASQPDKSLWTQTITVTPSTSYVFSGWAASWGKGGTLGDPNPASLLVQINGAPVGDLLQLPATDGQWTQWGLQWDSGTATTATIRIVDTNTNWYGNDFAVDDLALTAQAPANSAPTDLALSNASVAENQPIGTSVGTFSTTDPDSGDAFTYALVSGTGSDDNALFTISGTTLRTAASLNYESKNSYSIRVRTTDQGGLSMEKAFTISVTDVNDAAPLTITGTDAANTISITVANGQYTITQDGVTSTAWIGEVSSITIQGLGGNDTIIVGAGIVGCSIDGGIGDDTIYGGEGNDTIRGDAGNDSIYGGDGDDSLSGNTGDDSLYGAAGADQLQGGLGADNLSGGLGNDSLYGGDGSDSIYGDDGDDYIEARGKPDTVQGGTGNDTIWGGAGNDLIYGEEGDDWIDIGYSSFSDTVYGGDGSDTVQHTPGDTNDTIGPDVEYILA